MIEFVYVLCALAVVIIICILMMNWYAELDKKTKIEMIAREYILRMETAGYLSEANQNQLCEELKEQGLFNLSLAGTTKEIVTYGEKIYLTISASLETKTFRMEDWMKMKRGTQVVEVKIKKSSTAKN